jgi:hypothetical protein
VLLTNPVDLSVISAKRSRGVLVVVPAWIPTMISTSEVIFVLENENPNPDETGTPSSDGSTLKIFNPF